MQFIIENKSFVLTVASTLVGILVALIQLVIRIYGMTRDINHLKRDYRGLSGNLDTLLKEFERRLDEVEKDLAVAQYVSTHLSARIAGDRNGGLLGLESEQ